MVLYVKQHRGTLISSPDGSYIFAISLHVVLALLLVKLTLLLGGGVLVLLVLGDEVVHVALGLRELHLVHPFACVPMQESLAAEHRCEELCNSLEHLLDGSRIPSEGNRHLQALRWNVANTGLDVVGNPLYKVA